MTGKLVALEEALTVADEKLHEFEKRENEWKEEHQKSEQNSEKVRKIFSS